MAKVKVSEMVEELEESKYALELTVEELKDCVDNLANDLREQADTIEKLNDFIDWVTEFYPDAEKQYGAIQKVRG